MIPAALELFQFDQAVDQPWQCRPGLPRTASHAPESGKDGKWRFRDVPTHPQLYQRQTKFVGLGPSQLIPVRQTS